MYINAPTPKRGTHSYQHHLMDASYEDLVATYHTSFAITTRRIDVTVTYITRY